MCLFGFIDVEADHTEAGAGISEQERQADIAEADDADGGSVRKGHGRRAESGGRRAGSGERRKRRCEMNLAVRREEESK